MADRKRINELISMTYEMYEKVARVVVRRSIAIAHSSTDRTPIWHVKAETADRAVRQRIRARADLRGRANEPRRGAGGAGADRNVLVVAYGIGDGEARDGRAEVHLPQHVVGLVVEGPEAPVDVAAEQEAAAGGDQRHGGRALVVDHSVALVSAEIACTVPSWSNPGANWLRTARGAEFRAAFAGGHHPRAGVAQGHVHGVGARGL